MMNILELKDISKRYTITRTQTQRYKTLYENMDIRKLFKKPPQKIEKHEFYALKNISFSVKCGEKIGIIGRNGAGKSTLLKVISRITDPTSGMVGINGRVASLLEVGTGFHPELTGRENIYLNGTILGMKQTEITKKFDEIVEFSGISDFIDVPVKRYSSGMYVRLAFAVAAHLESEILIVDEVLAVGDAAFQKKCLNKMNEISNSGRTILFVTHNLSTLQGMCERSIYLKNGEMVFDGKTSAAIQNYLQDNQDDFFGLGFHDLTQVQRQGTGDALFKSVELLAHNKEPDDTNAFRTGDDLTVRMHLQGIRSVADTNVAVIIYDIYGTRIIDANLAIVGESVSFAPGKDHSIDITLKDVLLKPGEYILGLWCGIPNTNIDAITEAIRFRIDEKLSSEKYSITFDGFYQCDFTINISQKAV